MILSNLKLLICLISISCDRPNEKLSELISVQDISSLQSRFRSPIDDGHNVTDFLPPNYAQDGSVDYTRYIQLAINKHDKLIFPGFPLLVNDTGLNIPSNRTLQFLKGSELRMKPSLKQGYAIIDIKEAKNVTLYNPVIIGDRYNHLGTGGEWGMGISIKGASNVRILGARISECWGDGIYIGQSQNVYASNNITIKDTRLVKNRRDGISVISVDGLILENIYAAYQDGTKPMCGINFETNNSNCEIKGVQVINPRTEFNKGNGIQIALSTMLGGISKNVNVVVLNHVDRRSNSFAFKVACNRKDGITGGNVMGFVNIINPSWNQTIGDRPLSFVTDQLNLKVEIKSVRIKKANGRMLDHSEINAILKKHSNGNLIILK